MIMEKYMAKSVMRVGRILLLWPLLSVFVACEQADAPAKTETALEHARKHLDPTYVCPMHPQIVKDSPGNCPICGMQLVEKKQTSESTNLTVELDHGTVQKLGVRSEAVRKGRMAKTIRLLGRVDYDEKNVAEIRTSTYGWVENLGVRSEGLQVKRGQLLLELYSPEYLDAQKKFLKAQKQDKSGITKKYGQRSESVPVRDYLRYLGIPDSSLNEIARTGQTKHRIPVYAPQFGVIVRHNVHKHQFLEEDFLMFTVADLSTVWVVVEVPEYQLQWIRRGMKATLEVPAFPGKSWNGRVDYLYPELDLASRSLKVRLSVPNFSGELKPNMLADVYIASQSDADVLKIPSEALIMTGEREAVIVALGEGKFRPVDVVSGLREDGDVEIISGLNENDRVVVSGQFLLDSEANLQAGFKRINADYAQH